MSNQNQNQKPDEIETFSARLLEGQSCHATIRTIEMAQQAVSQPEMVVPQVVYARPPQQPKK